MAVKEGYITLVLSDFGVQQGLLPIHALLATGAVHQRLTQDSLRCDANLVIETATARDPHHVAALIGFGATAVYPYLSYYVINHLVETGDLLVDISTAYKNYHKSIDKGLLKIISKMGISTVASYRGAQLFEAIGLDDEVVNTCFAGTPSRIQGAGFADLEADQKPWPPTPLKRANPSRLAACSNTCTARNTTRTTPT